MYDATTVALMAIYFLLKTKKPTTNCSNIANKLHPSASRNQANQFVLGRDDKDGALHQKFKHSQLLQLEQQAEQARSLYHQDQQALQQWKVLANQREDRLNQMATGEPDYAQDNWSKEVDRSITNLIAFLDLFRYKQKTHKQKQVIKLSKSAIQELLSSSFSPANDDRIKAWLSYPGVSTAVRRSREIDSLATDISKLKPESIQELLDLSSKAFKSAVAIASSQAGPIVVSILATSISRADKALSKTNSSAFNLRSETDWDKLWQNSTFLLSSKQQTWPDRKFHTIGDLFKTAEDYQNWSQLTGNYLMQKASSECERFIPTQRLNKIGIKDNDGIWKARHRLYHVNHASPSLNISGDPFLIDSRSPLAWSIALFVHNTAAASPLLWRPSSRTHKHWRECHRKSLKYGVILGYQTIFKRIERSCMICIKRKAKVCRVAGGPLHFTQLTQAKYGANSTFKYIMLDLTAPLQFGKTDTDQNVLHTLVSVCLVSKLTHVVPMDKKKRNHFCSH